MRIAPFAIISSMVALLACGTVPNVNTTDSSTSGTDTDTSSGTDSSGQNPTTSNGSSGVCVPGTSIACTCTNGSPGAQVCNAQGSGYDVCECEGGSNSESDSTPTTDPGTSTSSTTDPGTTTDMTTDPGTSTDPGTTTETSTTTDTGTSTTTGGVMCEDPGEEPNEDEPSAVDLGEQNCGDQPETLSGMLAGPTDVDWFTWHGNWGNFCGFGGPEGEHVLTVGENIRLCVFVECDNGSEMIECGGDATMNDSPEGRPGCCNQGDVVFSTLNCTMAEEDLQFFVRLDQAPEDACVDYEVEYDFNN